MPRIEVIFQDEDGALIPSWTVRAGFQVLATTWDNDRRRLTVTGKQESNWSREAIVHWTNVPQPDGPDPGKITEERVDPLERVRRAIRRIERIRF